MTFKKVFTTYLGFVFFICFVSSQDTILLLNGKRIFSKTDVIQEGDKLIYSKKNKTASISTAKVYGLYTSDGEQIIFYEQDTLYNIPDNEQMFQYLEGMTLAWENYCNPYIPVAGFIISAGAGIWPGVVLGFFVPLLYTGIIILQEPEINQSYFPENRKDEHFFSLGYKDVIWNKKAKSALFAASSGYVTGILINMILINPIK